MNPGAAVTVNLVIKVVFTLTIVNPSISTEQECGGGTGICCSDAEKAATVIESHLK